jgi:uncharacterized membrane protein
MPQHDTSWWVGFGLGLVGGSLLVGVLLGLIPIVVGQLVAQTKLGRVGFVVTVLASFVGGVVLAVPASLAFVVAVLWQWRRVRRTLAASGTHDA